MNDSKDTILNLMKQSLRARIEEWIGFDIPDEGTEDYDRWQIMNDEVEGIASIDDVLSYLESEGVDVEDFLVTGEYDLITAGMTPEAIPLSVFECLGEDVTPEEIADGGESRVLMCWGRYFVVSHNEKFAPQVFATLESASNAIGA